MRKEVILAIIAGTSIGLIIAFGAWKLTQTFKKTSVINEIKKNLPQQNKISLSVGNLTDFDIITTSPFLINGITKPNSRIVISTHESDFYTQSDNDGSFETEIDLPVGLSELKVGVPQSQETLQKIKVVYSSEFAKYIEEKDANNDSDKNATSSSENEIREKISKVSLKKIAYVGTITDISSGTIQIKSIQGDIKQMSLGDNTSYVNTLKKNIEIKSTDLAIGDYIVAMGFVNGNKVLDAKRILIAGPLTENRYEAVQGTITQISKTKLTITQENGEVLEITLPKKWTGPDVKSLDENQKIIVVGMNNDQKFDLRTIFVEDSI